MPQVIVDPVRRQRYAFSHEGDRLRFEVAIGPGGDVPYHLHPAQEERWEVVRGEVRFRLGDRWTVVGPGERLAAPPGVPHAFENVGGEEAFLRAEVSPALDLQDFLEEAAALARAGKFTRRGAPRGLRAALELVELADRYRGVVVLAQPPPALQKLIFPPLARLQRWLRKTGRS